MRLPAHKTLSVASLILVLVIMSFAPVVASAASTLDFGDAPDGKLTGYTGGATVGSFPSLLTSDGARTADVATIWLGDKVDKESDSKQVDVDAFDDGVAVTLSSCATSKASLLVHVTKPGTTSGTAYLNMFFDWDKNGKWGGTDSCGADEWAVRNVPVDLSAQTTAVAVYVPSFLAGKNVTNIWYRAAVTLDERMLSETGTGSYAKGEVEDYGPARKPANAKKFGAYCKPNPLILFHGAAGKFEIKPKPGSVPITFVGLANNVTPNTKQRKLQVAGLTVRYTSKKVDKPNRVVFETVPVRVRFGTTASIIVKCNAVVIHFTPRVPQQQNVHDYTTTKVTGAYTVTTSGTNRILRTRFTPIDTEMVALRLTGVDIPLAAQGLPDPHSVDLNINGQGFPPDWRCDLVPSSQGNIKRCQGTTPLQLNVDSFFDIWFATGFTPPRSLHAHLLSNGEVVAAVDLPFQEGSVLGVETKSSPTSTTQPTPYSTSNLY